MARSRPKDEQQLDHHQDFETSLPNSQSFNSFYWCCCCEIDLSNEGDFLVHLESIDHLQCLMGCHLLSQKTYRLIYLLFQTDKHRCNLCGSDFSDAGDFLIHLSMCGVCAADPKKITDVQVSKEAILNEDKVPKKPVEPTTPKSKDYKTRRSEIVIETPNFSKMSKRRKQKAVHKQSESSLSDTESVKSSVSVKPQIQSSNSHNSKVDDADKKVMPVESPPEYSENTTPSAKTSFCAICDVNVEKARMPSHLTSQPHFENWKRLQVKEEASDSDDCVVLTPSLNITEKGTKKGNGTEPALSLEVNIEHELTVEPLSEISPDSVEELATSSAEIPEIGEKEKEIPESPENQKESEVPGSSRMGFAQMAPDYSQDSRRNVSEHSKVTDDASVLPENLQKMVREVHENEDQNDLQDPRSPEILIRKGKRRQTEVSGFQPSFKATKALKLQDADSESREQECESREHVPKSDDEPALEMPLTTSIRGQTCKLCSLTCYAHRDIKNHERDPMHVTNFHDYSDKNSRTDAKGRIHCKICNVRCDTDFHFRIHKSGKKHLLIMNSYCWDSWEQGSPSEFPEHLLTCPPQIFQCNTCFKTFPDISILLSHTFGNAHKNIDQPESFSCFVCRESFGFFNQLKKHDASNEHIRKTYPLFDLARSRAHSERLEKQQAKRDERAKARDDSRANSESKSQTIFIESKSETRIDFKRDQSRYRFKSSHSRTRYESESNQSCSRNSSSDRNQSRCTLDNQSRSRYSSESNSQSTSSRSSEKCIVQNPRVSSKSAIEKSSLEDLSLHLELYCHTCEIGLQFLKGMRIHLKSPRHRNLLGSQLESLICRPCNKSFVNYHTLAIHSHTPSHVDVVSAYRESLKVTPVDRFECEKKKVGEVKQGKDNESENKISSPVRSGKKKK